jgi:hypothetical protein
MTWYGQAPHIRLIFLQNPASSDGSPSGLGGPELQSQDIKAICNGGRARQVLIRGQLDIGINGYPAKSEAGRGKRGV